MIDSSMMRDVHALDGDGDARADGRHGEPDVADGEERGERPAVGVGGVLRGGGVHRAHRSGERQSVPGTDDRRSRRTAGRGTARSRRRANRSCLRRRRRCPGFGRRHGSEPVGHELRGHRADHDQCGGTAGDHEVAHAEQADDPRRDHRLEQADGAPRQCDAEGGQPEHLPDGRGNVRDLEQLGGSGLPAGGAGSSSTMISAGRSASANSTYGRTQRRAAGTARRHRRTSGPSDAPSAVVRVAARPARRRFRAGSCSMRAADAGGRARTDGDALGDLDRGTARRSRRRTRGPRRPAG